MNYSIVAVDDKGFTRVVQIKAYFRSLLCRAASWIKYRRPVLVRRYVVIERDTLEKELKDVSQWWLDAVQDVQTVQKRLDELTVTERLVDASREEEYQKRLQAEKISEIWREAAHGWSNNYDQICKTMEDERSAAAAQIKSLEGQLNSAIIEAADIKVAHDREVAEHNKTYSRFCELERKYAKLRRAIEDVRAATAGAS